MNVTFHDPRHDPEPDGWAAWRTTTGRWANWAWPVMRAGASNSRDPLLVAVFRDGPAITGVVTASARPVVPRNRVTPPSGWPAVGYLDVAAPQSSAQPGWWFADPGERAAMFRAYQRAVRGSRRLGAIAILWRQVSPSEVDRLPRAVLTRATEPVAVLDTPFLDRDSWLATLRKSRRTDMRRIARTIDGDPDLTVKAGPAGDLVTPDELTHLARLNFDRHPAALADRRTGPRSLAWNIAMSKRDDTTAIVYRDGSGRILGAGLVLDHPTRPLWLSWGAEPDGRRHLYFDLFNRLVDRATAVRADAVVLGKGMPDLKRDLGARLEPQFAVVTV